MIRPALLALALLATLASARVLMEYSEPVVPYLTESIYD